MSPTIGHQLHRVSVPRSAQLSVSFVFQFAAGCLDHACASPRCPVSQVTSAGSMSRAAAIGSDWVSIRVAYPLRRRADGRTQYPMWPAELESGRGEPVPDRQPAEATRSPSTNQSTVWCTMPGGSSVCGIRLRPDRLDHPVRTRPGRRPDRGSTPPPSAAIDFGHPSTAPPCGPTLRPRPPGTIGERQLVGTTRIGIFTVSRHSQALMPGGVSELRCGHGKGAQSSRNRPGRWRGQAADAADARTGPSRPSRSAAPTA